MAGTHQRGRGTTPKAKPITAATSSIDEAPIFKPEWFSGDPDVETETETETETKDAIKPPQKMTSYPSYVQAGLGSIKALFKGSICRRIMQLYAEDLSLIEIAKELGTSKADGGLRAADVEAIITACETLGLDGESPLEAEDWENAAIEGWWERSYCEELERNEPIGPDVAGYDCDQGWWAGKQDAKNRDWAWFEETGEIGPRRRPHRR